MWHQQRKEEKRIKGLMVDKRRRAERRRDYYEKIKMDPNQFLQGHELKLSMVIVEILFVNSF
jgi:arginine/serine-rich splicing factor 16